MSLFGICLAIERNRPHSGDKCKWKQSPFTKSIALDKRGYLHIISSFLILYSKNAMSYRALDKRGIKIDIVIISPRKHMLWVLIKSASLRNKTKY